jgi:hypothetical protein
MGECVVTYVVVIALLSLVTHMEHPAIVVNREAASFGYHAYFSGSKIEETVAVVVIGFGSMIVGGFVHFVLSLFSGRKVDVKSPIAACLYFVGFLFVVASIFGLFVLLLAKIDIWTYGAPIVGTVISLGFTCLILYVMFVIFAAMFEWPRRLYGISHLLLLVACRDGDYEWHSSLVKRLETYRISTLLVKPRVVNTQYIK